MGYLNSKFQGLHFEICFDAHYYEFEAVFENPMTSEIGQIWEN